MIIAVDFDGTCVTHEYPEVGRPIGAERVLRKLVKKGHKIILFTMRSNTNGEDVKPKRSGEDAIFGDQLDEAVSWFKNNNIPLYGVNVNPTQGQWTKSPKAYAELYIDDAALGCPLILDLDYAERPYVDWEEVEKMLKTLKIL